MNRLLISLISVLICIQISAQSQIGINSKFYSPRQLNRDIDYALMKFEQIHPNIYRDLPKDSVISRFKKLKSKIDKPMTRFDFMNIFAPTAFNIIRDGHNYVYPLDEEQKNYTKNGGKFFPIPVKIRNRKLYCNSTIIDIPYNSEIVEINKTPVREVIETVLSNYSPERDDYEEALCSDWFSNSFWQFYGGYKDYSIKYNSSVDSSNHSFLIPGRTAKEIDSIRLTKPIKNFEFEEIPELKTGIFKFNTMLNLNDLKSFCDSIFLIMKNKQYENLVIDVRRNDGGSSRLVDLFLTYITDKPVSQFDYIETKSSKEQKKEFIRGNHLYLGWFKWYNYLYYPIYIRSNDLRKKVMTAKNGTLYRDNYKPTIPKENSLKFKGHLYLLTSHASYSATNGLAAAFKCYKLGMIIGQETGQPTKCTINSITFQLPNTKITCTSSDMTIAYSCWKDDGHGVIPDYVINNDIYSVNWRDKEMDFVKEFIRNKK
jgi:hypothetical protein